MFDATKLKQISDVAEELFHSFKGRTYHVGCFSTTKRTARYRNGGVYILRRHPLAIKAFKNNNEKDQRDKKLRAAVD